MSRSPVLDLNRLPPSGRFSNSTKEERLARNASAGCAAGCGQPRYAWGRFCKRCKQRALRQGGNPNLRIAKNGELRSYVQQAVAYVKEHHRHPKLSAALDWIEEQLSGEDEATVVNIRALDAWAELARRKDVSGVSFLAFALAAAAYVVENALAESPSFFDVPEPRYAAWGREGLAINVGAAAFKQHRGPPLWPRGLGNLPSDAWRPPARLYLPLGRSIVWELEGLLVNYGRECFYVQNPEARPKPPEPRQADDTSTTDSPPSRRHSKRIASWRRPTPELLELADLVSRVDRGELPLKKRGSNKGTPRKDSSTS